MSGRSVLVTGASGLIGRRLVSLLAEDPEGIETVVAMDLRELPEDQRLAGIRYETGDIRDPQLGKRFQTWSIDTVVHLAAIVTPGKGSTRELEHSIDVLGTENVLRGCLEAGIGQLVYTSSGAAYGYHADNPVPLTERDSLRGNPEFAYSDHKRLVEEMLARARSEHPELRQLVFRPGTILGERVANPITAMFERPVILGVRGSDIPFVIVWDEDVARCIAKGIRERGSGIYNLAGDGVITLREMARRLGKPYLALPVVVLETALGLARTLGLTQLGPEQVNFLRYRPVLSNDRLKSEFGFSPTYTSEECFERYRRIRFGD
ncbi:MAG: SDR family oxidoreductase [Myxococcota bacterium]